MKPYILRALTDLPHLGITAGNHLIVRPGAPCPVIIRRDGFVNYGAIAEAVTAGDLEPVNFPLPDVDVLMAMGDSQPSAPPPSEQPPAQLSPLPPRSGAPTLRRLK